MFPIKYVRNSFDCALSIIDDGRTIDNVYGIFENEGNDG